MFVLARPLRQRSAFAALFLAALLAPALATAQSLSLQPELPNYGLLQKNLTPAYRQAFVADLESYHDCKGDYGCYKLDLDGQAAIAISDLNKAVQQNHGKKLALVLGIDETSLSNYPEMREANFEFVRQHWDKWVAQSAAPAIPSTLAIYRRARSLRVAVFFITGRPDTQRAATAKNLRAQGYAQWAGLTLRSPAEVKMPTVEYKSSERAKIVAAGYTLIESVGDQFSDLEGEPAAQYSIKLPDPFYYIP